jgi:hypothetical protein
MKYMLLFAANEDEWMAMPEADREEAIGRIGQWFGEHARAGRIVDGRRLLGRASAKTVVLGPAGRSRVPVVNDGPFVESKEVIGSYAVVDVPDMGDALEIAKSWPAGGLVEVRPVMDGGS